MDSTKRIGAAAISLIVMALWSAHILGYASNITPDNAEVLKATVYTVVGFWIGSSISPAMAHSPTQTLAGAAVAGAATALAAQAVPQAVAALTDLVEGDRK